MLAYILDDLYSFNEGALVMSGLWKLSGWVSQHHGAYSIGLRPGTLIHHSGCSNKVSDDGGEVNLEGTVVITPGFVTFLSGGSVFIARKKDVTYVVIGRGHDTPAVLGERPTKRLMEMAEFAVAS